MMVKTVIKSVFVLAVAFAMAFSSYASFEKKNTYDGSFSDVKDTSWYKNDVVTAFELGFVNGKSDTLYCPDDTVTVSQAIAMASRIHAEYYDKTILEVSGGRWYDCYVDFAKKSGIITENQFDSLERDIKRSEMAELFCDAMGKEYYTPINHVVYVPDVPLGASYLEKLLTLYNAGIVMGNDEYGLFYPDDCLKRSECAAIICRVALSENRVRKNLLKISDKDAYVLCYNAGMAGNKEGINSGWVLDNRGGGAKSDNASVTTIGDVSEKYGSCFIREFNFIQSGKIVLETVVEAAGDGVYLEYADIEGNPVYRLKIVDGKWSILTKNGYENLISLDGNVSVRAEIDLDNAKSRTFLGGADFGTHALLSDNVICYKAGVDEKGTGAVSVSQVNMVVNYPVYENFDIFGTDKIYGWTWSGQIKRENDVISLYNNSSISKSFDKVSGKVCTQLYFLSPGGGDFEIEIGDILKLQSKNSKLFCKDKELYDITKNMWYRLRVEADTVEGKADILLNGRSIGNVSLEEMGAVSDITVTSEQFLCIDNLHVFELVSHDDYVPEPEISSGNDEYTVGVNVCSLWRNGTHYGWGCVSAYDEPIPVLGMYDEGVSETADWEIKFMTEHGIDFQSFCWYADSGKAPLKTPHYSEHLHNGYMYAKYSDYMKYCIIWEARSGTHFGSDYFRNHVIPYWFENYFLDSRYMTIDNKILLPVYGSQYLADTDYFSSSEGVKRELDYLESVAKEYGFDGVIFLAAGNSSDYLAEIGFDGTFAYGWGQNGKEYSHNVDSILNSAKNKKMYTVPTISVGFDSIAWMGQRYGNMTVADYEKSHGWVKNEYLPKYSKDYGFADKLVWLSTWNEYGEGTYIMPSGLNGFGYLDVLRNEYTNLAKDHEDAVPTLKQKARITHLYPQYAKLLRRNGTYYMNKTEKGGEDEPKNKLFINDIDVQNNAAEMYIIPPMEKEGRVLFPFNPSAAVNFVLGCHYEYRKDAGTLKIIAGGHEVIFEIGSDRYVLDKEEKDLGYTPVLFDGLVMLDFVSLASDLGYKTEEKDGNVYIFTDTYETLWKKNDERQTGTWQFNRDFDNEGFTSTDMMLLTHDGALRMTSSRETNDPVLRFAAGAFPEDFYTKKFTSVEIRCKYKYTPLNERSNHISLYYITDLDAVYDEKKSIKLYFENFDSGDEWVTLRADLTEVTPWQSADRLTGLRFDPFNGKGEMQVDYIRFTADPYFEYVPVEERKIEIVNGNAEADVLSFYSDNAAVTRVREPDNEQNHVWFVRANQGPVYTYFRQGTRFKPYTTYKIEYDIKLVGSNNSCDDGPVSTTFCTNFRYADKGALNDFDHVVSDTANTAISVSDGWKRYSATFTTGKIDSHEKSEFTVYLRPSGQYGFSFYIDNVAVTELGNK